MGADTANLKHLIAPDMRDSDLPAEVLHRQLSRVWGTPATLWGMLATVDHKHIGRRYIATAFIFLVLGGVLALIGLILVLVFLSSQDFANRCEQAGGVNIDYKVCVPAGTKILMTS